MLAAITGIIGIISTLLAWFLNPRRRLYAELDQIYKELEGWYVKRDKALIAHDDDTLTICNAAIIGLSSRKGILLQRLG
jgi:hypothetical protein